MNIFGQMMGTAMGTALSAAKAAEKSKQSGSGAQSSGAQSSGYVPHGSNTDSQISTVGGQADYDAIAQAKKAAYRRQVRTETAQRKRHITTLSTPTGQMQGQWRRAATLSTRRREKLRRVLRREHRKNLGKKQPCRCRADKGRAGDDDTKPV